MKTKVPKGSLDTLRGTLLPPLLGLRNRRGTLTYCSDNICTPLHAGRENLLQPSLPFFSTPDAVVPFRIYRVLIHLTYNLKNTSDTV